MSGPGALPGLWAPAVLWALTALSISILGPRTQGSTLAAQGPVPTQYPLWAAGREGDLFPVPVTLHCVKGNGAFVSSQVNPLAHCLGPALHRTPPVP